MSARAATAAACRACGEAGSLVPSVTAPERMFGMGGDFAYDACTRCGAVQIREVPADLARYYPAGYYAHAANADIAGMRARALRLRNALLYRAPVPIGTVVGLLSAEPRRLSRRWFRVTGTSRDSRILDVGCGRGQRLAELAAAGFTRLEGVDPYIAGPVSHQGGRARVMRGTIHDVPGDGAFDLVMFHHSLEHIEDQRGTMARAAALLRPGGWALVRVPTVSSWAWEHYGPDWVQLDPPRHLVLHSVESLRLLGASCGLTLLRVDFDSTEFQFTGSEGYRMGLTLAESEEAFGAATVRGWRREAYRLNRLGAGDQGAFYFRKSQLTGSGAPGP